MSDITEVGRLGLPGQILKLIGRTLSFEFISAGTTPNTPDMDTGWRSLPFAFVLQTIEGSFGVDFEDGRSVATGKGGGLIMPERTPHRIYCDGGEATETWAVFRCRILGTVDILSQLDFPTIIPEEAASRMSLSCAGMATLTQDREVWELQRIIRYRKLGYELLETILSVSSLRPDIGQSLFELNRLEPVLTYIQANLGKHMSLDELASVAHLSPSRFHAVFSRSLKKPPIEYVRSLQLQEAAMKLVTTDLPVYQIAEGSGFGDQFHFSRCFKREFGQSPSAYRKNTGVNKDQAP